MVKKLLRVLLRAICIPLEVVSAILLAGLLYIVANSHISVPGVQRVRLPEREKIAADSYRIGSSWLRKNQFGTWEMYIEGAPFERGVIYGRLAKELVQKQETIFVRQIRDFVPSSLLRTVLQTGLSFANKDLIYNIPEENLEEIYGVSLSFSDSYNYIAPKYTRILNYHAAHDIGHALNDYAVVGCTSFAVGGDKTNDSELMVGRNFDFYVGDAFAEEKILLFVNPDKGYKFASYSWAGFTGVASGMNETGLSVTINAAKSKVPTASKTPIAIVAREILQYASTIEEAVRIAEKRDVFVSESILVSSAREKKAGLIEKGPGKTGVYFSPSNTLVCANHFQSETFRNTPENQQNIKESDSKMRYDKVLELLAKKEKLELSDIAAILRNREGLNGAAAGMGNPGTLNQLQGHHSVIFEPERKKMWISTLDFQLGPYVSYDLAEIFSTKQAPAHYDTLASDPFRFTRQYRDYLEFRALKLKVFRYTHFNEPLSWNQQDIAHFISLNPDFYATYQTVGDYYAKQKNHAQAVTYYGLAQTKYLPSPAVRKELMHLEKEEKNAR